MPFLITQRVLRVPFLIAQRALKVPFFYKVTVPFFVPGVNTILRSISFDLMLDVPVNSYGHVGLSVHLTTLFSWARLTK